MLQIVSKPENLKAGCISRRPANSPDFRGRLPVCLLVSEVLPMKNNREGKSSKKLPVFILRKLAGLRKS